MNGTKTKCTILHKFMSIWINKQMHCLLLCRNDRHGQEAPEYTKQVIWLTDHILFPIAFNIYPALKSSHKTLKQLLNLWDSLATEFRASKSFWFKSFFSGIQCAEVAGMNGLAELSSTCLSKKNRNQYIHLFIHLQ